MKSKIISALLFVFFLGMITNDGSGQTHKKIIKIENKGKQGYLGVEIQDVTKKLKEKKNLSVDLGAYITGIVEDSPAEEAGIQKGDVITKFGEEAVDDGEELTDAVRAVKPKTKVKVEINRKGEKKIVDVVVGKMKTPEAFTFNLNDDGMHWLSPPPGVPKLGKKFNIRVFTNSDVQGLQLQPLTKQLGEYFGAPKGKGVLVTEVEKESGAEKAGFKAGDVITKVEGNNIKDIDDIHNELSDFDGKEASFEIIRNGKSTTLKMLIEKEEEDESEEDDWSSNVIVTPRANCMRTFRFDLTPSRLELDHLRDRLFDLREDIQRGVQKIKRTIKREFIES